MLPLDDVSHEARIRIFPRKPPKTVKGRDRAGMGNSCPESFPDIFSSSDTFFPFLDTFSGTVTWSRTVTEVWE